MENQTEIEKCSLITEYVPVTIWISPAFKSALEREATRLGYDSLQDMILGKMRFCLPENIRNVIK